MKKMADLKYHIGLKVRIYPDERVKRIVAINDGIRRSTYNHYVAYNEELYMLKKVKVYLKPVADRIDYLETVLSTKPNFKNMFPYMYGELADSDTVGNAIRNYNDAWDKFNKTGSGRPVFSKKSYCQHYQTSNHYKKGDTHMNDGSIRILDAGHVQLPIIGRIRMRGSKRMIKRVIAQNDTARIGTATIEMDATGRYWLSLSIASDVPFVDAPGKTGKSIGIDLNLTNLYTGSDGSVCENPKVRRSNADRLAKAERKLSLMAARAKREGRPLAKSRNYQKQRRKVADMHRHLAAVNEDFLNIQALGLVKNHDLICAEDLKVKDMLKNGTLARAISDVSWSMFLTLIQQKADMYGRTFVRVPPAYTTQTCSTCGHVCSGDEKIMLGTEEWTCPACGARHGRDYNSAINILNAGLGMSHV